MSSAAVAKTDKKWVALTALPLVAAAWGCGASPIGYATPRTVEAGKVTHTVAVDAPTGIDETIPIPLYIVRIGVHERVDFGLRILNGIDVKANAVRSKWFDASFNPRVQLTFGGHTNTTFVSLPVLLGLNLGSAVTLVASGGPVFTYRNDRDNRTFLEGNLSIDFRPTPSFAMHPAIAFTRGLESDAVTNTIIGFGFTFGALPKFQ